MRAPALLSAFVFLLFGTGLLIAACLKSPRPAGAVAPERIPVRAPAR